MHSSLRRCGLLLIPLILVCFALLPRAQAVLPAPDGGYPGGNTAEGTNARHYRQLVKPKQAERYWKIVPATLKNLVTFETAAA